MDHKNKVLQGKLDDALEKTKEILKQMEEQDIKQQDMQCKLKGL